MENLWAAWRRDFILGPKESGCVFCKRIKMRSDRENLILYRGKKNFVIMNRYPYNGGHLLIVPYAHKSDLEKLTTFEANEMFDLTRKSVAIIKKIMPADGFNIGMNLGAIAGAGIEGHLHIHVVPRFKGDTSYTAVVGNIKVQSISLLEIYDMLKAGFDRLMSKR
jgi:ATP adenylyltransferase